MSAPRAGATQPARAPRRWRARALAIAISLGASLAAGELLVRATIGTPLPERLPSLRVRANALRGWEMVPSELHYTYAHPVRVNALGLRGEELPAEKGLEVRVLALGDSLTYGQGVAEEDALPSCLERALEREDARGRAWRVVNAGHRGYATNQEIALLRELGPRIRPDRVLVFWYCNDLDQPDVPALHARLSASGPIDFDADAPLDGRARVVWRLKQMARRSALLMYVHDLASSALRPPPDESGRDEGMRLLGGQLDELVELAQGLGARACIAAIPEPAALRGARPSVELTRDALELARAKGIPTLDLLEAMRARFAADARLPILPYDGHYTAEANRVMGDCAAAWLLGLDG